MTTSSRGSNTTAGARRLDTVLARLRAPVDGASLAAFRIMFGLVAFGEVCRYLWKGWIDLYWVDPEMHFTYPGFGWVHPLPQTGMYALWVLLGMAAIGITLGAWYRLSSAVFAVGFGYCFLLDSARYLNHFYLIALLAALLAVVPANRVWSLDRWSRRRPGAPVPTWSLWLMRFQVAVVYVYGGIAKIEPDWLRGEPMSTWLAHERHAPLIGPLLTLDGAGIVAAWAGLFFDLFIVLFVWWRRTRPYALLGAAAFHLINNALFDIGVFPYLAFAALLLFCEPAWPRTAWARLSGRTHDTEVTFADPPALTGAGRRVVAPLMLGLAGVFVAVQLLVPLRHLVEPGRSNWTEAGHTFSWQMKLRDKVGVVTFRVVDPHGDATVVDPLETLPYWQYSKMAIRPEMIRQYAHHVAEQYADAGEPGVRVYARTAVSLNGRPMQPMVDPRVDLAAQKVSLGTPSWVVPLEHPLP